MHLYSTTFKQIKSTFPNTLILNLICSQLTFTSLEEIKQCTKLVSDELNFIQESLSSSNRIVIESESNRIPRKIIEAAGPSSLFIDIGIPSTAKLALEVVQQTASTLIRELVLLSSNLD